MLANVFGICRVLKNMSPLHILCFRDANKKILIFNQKLYLG